MKHFQMIVMLALGILFNSINISTQYYSEAFGQFPVIDGIKCDKAEHFNFHYHAHLDIFVNGFSVPCSCRNRYQAARLYLLVAHS